MGYVHHVWTNGLQSGSASRYIYYNVWEPGTNGFIIPSPSDPIGSRVDMQFRAGYANVDADRNGIAYVAYNDYLTNGGVPHSAVARDYAPHLGGFVPGQIPYPAGTRIVYPKLVCDRDNNILATATYGITGGTAYNSGYFAKGSPAGDSVNWGTGFSFMDSTEYISREIAASFHSHRAAMAWVHWPAGGSPFYGPNVFLRTSEDGGSTWSDPLNITGFAPLDTNCVHDGGNAIDCSQDTLRPIWGNVSVMFDQNDVIHVAFMARYLSMFAEDGSVGPYYHNDNASDIWHWDEVNQEFNLIAEQWVGSLTHDVGAAQAMCHRPSLAIDTTTGYLYCAYQQFDTLQWSAAGFLQSDAYVSVSTTGGRTWSVGTDVTNSDGGQETAAGNCRSERDITIARFVGNGVVHMQYELDLDAGTGINGTPEGDLTHNPILYQRVPTDQIPLRPLMNAYRVFRFDSTGYPRTLDTNMAVAEHPTLKPGQFALYQNYPNPFNPTTTIQFDLAGASVVTLKVFDVLGREVATLFDKAHLSAGVQMTNFDASTLTSGVYFYRLETPTLSQTRKMVVMK
jgi:hypothetical protein